MKSEHKENLKLIKGILGSKLCETDSALELSYFGMCIILS